MGRREPRFVPRLELTYRTVPVPKGPGTRAGVQYEHRVVAEQMLGRALRPNEQVRFVGEPPVGRPVRPSDLRVVETRSTGRRFRPDVDDWEEQVACKCGCGESIYRWNPQGQERRFIAGHQGQAAPSPAQEAILSALGNMGPSYPAEVAAATGRSPGVVSELLRRMKKRGLVSKHESGLWSHVGTDDSVDGERRTAS